MSFNIKCLDISLNAASTFRIWLQVESSSTVSGSFRLKLKFKASFLTRQKWSAGCFHVIGSSSSQLLFLLWRVTLTLNWMKVCWRSAEVLDGAKTTNVQRNWRGVHPSDSKNKPEHLKSIRKGFLCFPSAPVLQAKLEFSWGPPQTPPQRKHLLRSGRSHRRGRLMVPLWAAALWKEGGISIPQSSGGALTGRLWFQPKVTGALIWGAAIYRDSGEKYSCLWKRGEENQKFCWRNFLNKSQPASEDPGCSAGWRKNAKRLAKRRFASKFPQKKRNKKTNTR